MNAKATVIPITLHVATDDGYAVVSSWHVQRWVRRANAVLGPHGIQVDVRAVRFMDGNRSVTRWRHRRELAGSAPMDGTVHVFVIERLDLFKLRKPRRRVRGLHWRYRGLNRRLAKREYVVVTRDAPTTTLAHELGHLFGLRHSNAENNVMCSCRRGPSMVFTYGQGNSMRAGAQRWLGRQRSARLSRRR